MPASILYGLDFETVTDCNGAVVDVVPTNGDYEFVGLVHLQEAVQACESLGVPKEEWPIFNVEVPANVPLSQAVKKSRRIRQLLQALWDDDVFVRHRFLKQIKEIIQGGNLFFVVY